MKIIINLSVKFKINSMSKNIKKKNIFQYFLMNLQYVRNMKEKNILGVKLIN